MRNLIKLYEKDLEQIGFTEQLYSKYFKTQYAGKPTKRYVKLMQKINESESIPYEQKELLYIS